MLRGAMRREGRVGLLLNVRKTDLPAVLKISACLAKPNGFFTLRLGMERRQHDSRRGIVRHIVPQLKQAGACGIVEYPLSKIID